MFQGKPVSDLLREIENGQFLSEASAAVYELVQAVMDTRKPGSVTIKLKFSPTGKGTVEIDADFDAKKPEHDRPSTTFFVGKDFSLLRDDPQQQKLPLRAVETPANDPVKVSS